MILDRVVASNDCAAMSGAADDKPGRALLQTWGTAARSHPVGGLGSIGELLIAHNPGFGQGRGSNSECSFNQAHRPHDTWLQSPCPGLPFAKGAQDVPPLDRCVGRWQRPEATYR